MRKFEKPKFKITDVDESSSKAVGTVDPNDLIGLGHCGHLVNPIKNILIVGHNILFQLNYNNF